MNERIARKSNPGNSGQTLKYWGLLFLTAGIVGRAVIENSVITTGGLSFAESLQNLDMSGTNVALVASSIFMRVINCCAIPLFLFLLVEGALYTKNFGHYFLRIAGLAVVSEIPYDLAMNNSLFHWNEQNPVFGLLFGLIMIYFYKIYAKGKLKAGLMYLIVTLFACLWVIILHVTDGLYMVIMVTTLWITRKSRRAQLYVGALVACLCITLYNFESGNTIPSLFYLASPLSFLMVFRYNDDPGEGNRWINYAAYPVLLLCGWIVGKVLF